MVGKFTVSDDEEEEYGRVRCALDDEAVCGRESEEDWEDQYHQIESGEDDFIELEESNSDVKGKKTRVKPLSSETDSKVKGKKAKIKSLSPEVMKRKRDNEKYQVDKEDLELLEENRRIVDTTIAISKPKRLKRGGKHALGEEFCLTRDYWRYASGETSAQGKLRGKIKGDKFDPPEESDEEFDYDDDLSDFIVEDEDFSVERKPLNRKRPKSNRKISSQRKGVIGKGISEEASSGTVGRLEDEFLEKGIKDNVTAVKSDNILETDVPERMQLLEEIVGPFSQDEDTHLEAKWVYERLCASARASQSDFGHILNLESELVTKEISNVLKMLHIDRLEVPFIAMYRKEKCFNIMNEGTEDEVQNASGLGGLTCKLRAYQVLWAIQHWDIKWLLLQKKKSNLKASYEKLVIGETTRMRDKMEIFFSIVKSVDSADSEDAINNIEAKFSLHFPSDDTEIDGEFKRPKRKSFYSICRKWGLGPVSQRLGLGAEKFGQNLLARSKIHIVEDDNASPEEYAAAFRSQEFKDAQSVLCGARHMAAVELGCEAVVMENVRAIFMKHGMVTTSCTDGGRRVIDSFHLYDPVKQFRDKPFASLDNYQWLLISRAEEENLLQASIYLPKNIIEEDLLPTFEKYYLSHRSDRVSELWNEQRKLILKDALHGFILPKLEKDARKILLERAKGYLIKEYRTELWKKVSIAPFDIRGLRSRKDEHADTVKDCGNCVMACCQGVDKEPTTVVMLDPCGEVLEIKLVSFLLSRSKNPVTMKQKEIDEDTVLKLMITYQPHVIAIGASNMRSKYLKDVITEVVSKLDSIPGKISPLKVLYVDEALPKLYENSSISETQLSSHKGTSRRAVAIGRYLIDPLAMVATLCGRNKEILSWKLHPVDSFLDAEERCQVVEQVMVTVTNQVGVDVNLAIRHSWMFAPLQFVCGLGPTKAAFIQRVLEKMGPINSRNELLVHCKNIVYRNAIGFLRVRAIGSNDNALDPLDDSRIHPESYKLAREMALSMYCEVDNKDMDAIEEEEREMAMKHLRDKGCIVNSGNQHIESIKQKTGCNDYPTLQGIYAEILNGFSEYRFPYTEPDRDEEFCMLTGSNEGSLAVGKTVQATVRKVLSDCLVCNIDLGLTAFIGKEDICDDRNADLKDVLSEGSILNCQIKCLEKDRFLVRLTCKTNAAPDWRNNQENDNFGNKETLEMEARKDKVRGRMEFTPRLITHPWFKNICAEEAKDLLAAKDTGEFVIYPSTKGSSYLNLTLKVIDGIYAHKVIIEQNKEQKDLQSYLRLGKTLSIGEKSFVSLDDLIDNYVHPVVAKLKSVLSNERFTKVTSEDTERNLMAENFENVNGIPFYLSASEKYPGAIILSYVDTGNPQHEFVGILPDGFRFRKTTFKNLEELLVYFQSHPSNNVDNFTHRGNNRGRSSRRGGRRGGRRGRDADARDSSPFDEMPNNSWAFSSSDYDFSGANSQLGGAGNGNAGWGGLSSPGGGNCSLGVPATAHGGEGQSSWEATGANKNTAWEHPRSSSGDWQHSGGGQSGWGGEGTNESAGWGGGSTPKRGVYDSSWGVLSSNDVRGGGSSGAAAAANENECWGFSSSLPAAGGNDSSRGNSASDYGHRRESNCQGAGDRDRRGRGRWGGSRGGRVGNRNSGGRAANRNLGRNSRGNDGQNDSSWGVCSEQGWGNSSSLMGSGQNNSSWGAGQNNSSWGPGHNNSSSSMDGGQNNSSCGVANTEGNYRGGEPLTVNCANKSVENSTFEDLGWGPTANNPYLSSGNVEKAGAKRNSGWTDISVPDGSAEWGGLSETRSDRAEETGWGPSAKDTADNVADWGAKSSNTGVDAKSNILQKSTVCGGIDSSSVAPDALQKKLSKEGGIEDRGWDTIVKDDNSKGSCGWRSPNENNIVGSDVGDAGLAASAEGKIARGDCSWGDSSKNSSQAGVGDSGWGSLGNEKIAQGDLGWRDSSKKSFGNDIGDSRWASSVNEKSAQADPGWGDTSKNNFACDVGGSGWAASINEESAQENLGWGGSTENNLARDVGDVAWATSVKDESSKGNSGWGCSNEKNISGGHARWGDTSSGWGLASTQRSMADSNNNGNDRGRRGRERGRGRGRGGRWDENRAGGYRRGLGDGMGSEDRDIRADHLNKMAGSSGAWENGKSYNSGGGWGEGGDGRYKEGHHGGWGNTNQGSDGNGNDGRSWSGTTAGHRGNRSDHWNRDSGSGGSWDGKSNNSGGGWGDGRGGGYKGWGSTVQGSDGNGNDERRVSDRGGFARGRSQNSGRWSGEGGNRGHWNSGSGGSWDGKSDNSGGGWGDGGGGGYKRGWGSTTQGSDGNGNDERGGSDRGGFGRGRSQNRGRWSGEGGNRGHWNSGIDGGGRHSFRGRGRGRGRRNDSFERGDRNRASDRTNSISTFQDEGNRGSTSASGRQTNCWDISDGQKGGGWSNANTGGHVLDERNSGQQTKCWAVSDGQKGDRLSNVSGSGHSADGWNNSDKNTSHEARWSTKPPIKPDAQQWDGQASSSGHSVDGWNNSDKNKGQEASRSTKPPIKPDAQQWDGQAKPTGVGWNSKSGETSSGIADSNQRNAWGTENINVGQISLNENKSNDGWGDGDPQISESANSGW